MKLALFVLLKLVILGSVWGAASPVLSASSGEVVISSSRSLDTKLSLIAQTPKTIAAFKQGRDFYLRRNYDDALKTFQRITEQEPEYGEAWYWQGMTLYNQRDYQNAIVALKKATQLDAKNPIFWKARGDAMNALAQYTPDRPTAIDRYDLAVDAYDRALKFMTSRAVSDRAATWAGRSESLFAQGNLLASQQNPDALQKYQDSIISYDEVIKLAVLDQDITQQVNALWQKGEAFRRVAMYGEEADRKALYAKALTSFDRATQLKADLPDCWYRRGRVLEELGQVKEALSSYDQAVRFDPEYAEALHSRGRLLAKLNQLEAALNSFDKAIKGTIRNEWALETKLNPAEIWYGRGLVLYELKHYQPAIASFEQAIKLKPNFVEAQNYRRYAQKQLHR